MWRPVAIVAGIASLFVASAARPGAHAASGSYAPVTTRIAVKLSQRLSSQDAREGEAFLFETTSAVAVDGYFVSAGAHGRGIVVAARVRRGSQPGELRLAARSLDLPDGDALPVALAPGELARTAIVFERGTPFVVVAPPPDPEASATGEGEASAG